jgi:hypothetical protein
MRWRRVEPLQDVSALLMTGAEAPRRLAGAMAAKPALLRALPVAFGEDWAAIFASPAIEEDALLPRLADTMALYEAVAGIWLPVGVVPAIPDHAKAAVLRAMLEREGVAAPAILVPRAPGGKDAAADLYVIGETMPFDRSALGGGLDRAA